jgi:hypothetical protein
MRISVRGEITGISVDVKVHVNSGENVMISLTQDIKVRAVTLANIEDINPGNYIGSAAVRRKTALSKRWKSTSSHRNWPAIDLLIWSRAAALRGRSGGQQRPCADCQLQGRPAENSGAGGCADRHSRR